MTELKVIVTVNSHYCGHSRWDCDSASIYNSKILILEKLHLCVHCLQNQLQYNVST